MTADVSGKTAMDRSLLGAVADSHAGGMYHALRESVASFLARGSGLLYALVGCRRRVALASALSQNL